MYARWKRERQTSPSLKHMTRPAMTARVWSKEHLDALAP
jgi:hypothetical protein